MDIKAKKKYELGETLYTITFDEKYEYNCARIPVYLGLDNGTIIPCSVVSIGINDKNILVYDVKSAENNILYKRYGHALFKTKKDAQRQLKKLKGEENGYKRF